MTAHNKNIGMFVFCLAFACLFAYFIFSIVSTAWKLSCDGKIVQATVQNAKYTSHTGPRGSVSRDWSYLISYDGNIKWIDRISQRLSIGSGITVVYSPSSPGDCELYSGQENFQDYLMMHWQVMFFVLPAIMFGAGAKHFGEKALLGDDIEPDSNH